MPKPIALLLKSHVDTYTRKDGTVVGAHDDKRRARLEREASRAKINGATNVAYKSGRAEDHQAAASMIEEHMKKHGADTELRGHLEAHQQEGKQAHADTPTKDDAPAVQAYDESRPIYAKPHPSGKHRHGDDVFFPHPDPKKKGKNALGKYMGHSDDGKSVVKHEQGGDKMYAMDHEHVRHARGIPKSASSKDLAPSFGDYLKRGKDA